jgi:hypothetical protein
LLGMEAFDTIRSYSVEAAVAFREAMASVGTALYIGRRELPYEAFVDRVPADHLRFFEGLRPYCQTADCLCVHGGLDARIADLQDQPRDALIWGAGDFPNGYEGAEIVVCGTAIMPSSTQTTGRFQWSLDARSESIRSRTVSLRRYGFPTSGSIRALDTRSPDPTSNVACS